MLIYLGKAEIIVRSNKRVLRTISARIPVPSIVRLDLYIKRPPKKVVLTRRNIIKRDGHRCQYCGQSRTAMTVDHVIPKNRGGADTWENLVCACIRCNNQKGDRTPEEVGIPLRRKPRRPSHITYIQRFVGIIDQRWKQYLFLN